MQKVVFLRHGQSAWNRDRRYTGWTDVGLSSEGREQAQRSGQRFRERGLAFDVAFTSVLRRSRETLELALEALGGPPPEIHASWRLNERHYGALQGVGKEEAKERFAPDELFRWVRSFDVCPPALAPEELELLRNDPLYADVDPEDLPATESLADTLQRTLPYWNESIAPAIRAGRRVLVVAHLNSLRALIKHLEGVSNTQIATLSIHAGEPFTITFDDELRPLRRSYLHFQPRLALIRAARRVLRGRKARAWLTKG